MYTEIIVAVILFILTGVCNAVMDKLQFHFDRSIFSKQKNQQWWNPDLSWKNKYIGGEPRNGRKMLWPWLGIPIYFPVQITDAWHLFKTIQIILEAAAVTTLCYRFIEISMTPWINWLILIILIGVARNYAFSLFFDKILAKR